jgi:nitrite reductase/ring-hydroxylating ferredoxin subunit
MNDDRERSQVPIWKRDFPYEAAGEEEVTRREFARFLVLGATTIAAGNVGLAAWTSLHSINVGEPQPIVELFRVPIGDSYLFRYPSKRDPAVLLRVDGERVVAFSQKCTHLGCVVFFESEQQRWHCPCHEGNFDALTGGVVSGPPTRPLGKIDVEVRNDGVIWAVGRSQ